MKTEKLSDWDTKNVSNFRYRMSIDSCHYKKDAIELMEENFLKTLGPAIQAAFIAGAVHAYIKLTNPEGDVKYAEDIES